MKTEIIQPATPVQPGPTPEISLPTGIDSISGWMIIIVFIRLILGQPPNSKP